MNKKNKVLVLGAAFVDVIMKIPNLPSSGEDITGDFKSYKVGGSAFNVDGALNHTNAASDLFVPVGSGQYSRLVKQVLSSKGLPILIEDSRKDNGWDICLVEPSGERTFITVQGIEQYWSSKWFDSINLSDYKYFYVSGYETEDKESTEVILRNLKNRRDDSYILFDTSPRIRYIDNKIINKLLIRNVMVHCNENELVYLSDKMTLDERVQEIYAKTKSPVMVTLGAKGTLIYDSHGKRVVQAEHVPVVNTIGAGDTHCGGVLSGLQQGMTIDEAVSLGNKLSAKVVQQESGSL